MAITQMEYIGSGGGTDIKTVTFTFNSSAGNNTVPVSGLSVIYAVFILFNNNVYGGGIDNNGTWTPIRYANGSAYVSSVDAGGASFVFYTTDARNNLTAYVLGEE